MSNSIEKQSQRFEFLKLVYDTTQGIQNKLVNMWDIGEELGLDKQTIEAVAQYLVGEGLIKVWTFGGSLSITQLGIKEIERATTDLPEPTEHFPDVFNMSGDFRGAVINIKSNLTRVSQSINAIPNSDLDVKAELGRLVDELAQLLQSVPSENIDDAEAVAWATESLLKTLNVDKPNKTVTTITAEGLKKAAQNLSEIVPSILPIVEQIISVVIRRTTS